MLIDGYVNKSCYYNGEEIEMYLNYSTTIVNYNIDIYDLNLNIVDTIPNINVFENSKSNINPCENGAGYSLTAKFNIKNYISGVYLIDKKISFIVKEKKLSDFIVVYPNYTIEIYNIFGGKNGYYGLEFAFSCRAMGKKVEDYVIIQLLKNYNKPIQIKLEKTEKNNAFINIFKKYDFKEKKDILIHDCDNKEKYILPKWFT